MEERTDRDNASDPQEPGPTVPEDLGSIVPEVVPTDPAPAAAEVGETVTPDDPASVTGSQPVEAPTAEETPTPSGDTEPGAAVEGTTDIAAEPEAEAPAPAAGTVESAEDAASEGDSASEDAPAEDAGTDDAEILPRIDTAAAAVGDDTPAAPVIRGRVPWWPFIIYVVAWIALIGTAFYLVSYEPDALPAFQQEEYPYILLGGLVLTVIGPLLALIVWFITWLRTDKDKRGGLLTSALLKGAIVTCFGVLAWWGAIAVLDALRLGMIGPIG